MAKTTSNRVMNYGRTQGIGITAYDWFKETDLEARESVLKEIGAQRLLPSEPGISDYKLNKLRGEER